MKVIKEQEFYYVVFEGHKIYKSHIKLDCVQYIFAKTMERRCSR